LKLLALGQSNKEVAAAREISVKTVNAHRSGIMRKLRLRSHSDLIQFAIRHRILEIQIENVVTAAGILGGNTNSIKAASQGIDPIESVRLSS
jgi:hypothetical protein